MHHGLDTGSAPLLTVGTGDQGDERRKLHTLEFNEIPRKLIVRASYTQESLERADRKKKRKQSNKAGTTCKVTATDQ